MSKYLNNTDLRDALNTTKLRDISDVYCDLDFAVGNITTKLVLSFNPTPSNITVNLNQKGWSDLKLIYEQAKVDFGIRLIVEQPSEVESTYNSRDKENTATKNKILKLHNKIHDLGIDGIIENIV